MFKIDPDGGWGNDAFPTSNQLTSGWTKIIIDGSARTIQSISRDMTPNCEGVSSSSPISSSSFSSNSSYSSVQASSSSIASSSLDSFSFQPIYDAPTSTEITSTAIKISGLDGVGFISILKGEFSIDNQAFQKNTSKIYNDQTLIIKVKSSGAGNTATQALLTLSDIHGSRTTIFTVTTKIDFTPNMFSFTPVINSQLSTAHHSNTIRVSGVNDSVPISISGENASYYTTNAGAYSNLPSTVNSGDIVWISLKSASKVNTTTSATLTIGTISQTFTITTVSEAEAPIAKFIFPALRTLTDKNSILVRGQAIDTNEITSVKVNGVEVTTTDNYANWQLNVPLVRGENSLTVSTKDNLNNYLNNVTTIKVASGTDSVPDSANEFDGPISIALDAINKRLIVSDEVVPQTGPQPTLYFVDLVTGARTGFNKGSHAPIDVIIDAADNRLLMLDYKKINSINLTSLTYKTFSENTTSDLTNFYDPYSIAIDTTRRRAIVVDQGNTSLISVDLSTGEKEILSNNYFPQSNYKFNKPYGIVIDESNNRALVLDSNDLTGLLIAVDLTTGARTVLRINSAKSTSFVKNPQSITLDKKRNRVLISEIDGGAINSVDLATGVTSPFGNLLNSNKIVIDPTKDVAYVASYWLKSIILVDLATGEQVIFSK